MQYDLINYNYIYFSFLNLVLLLLFCDEVDSVTTSVRPTSSECIQNSQIIEYKNHLLSTVTLLLST